MQGQKYDLWVFLYAETAFIIQEHIRPILPSRPASHYGLQKTTAHLMTISVLDAGPG